MKWTAVLVPVLGLLVYDPVPYDWHALKFVVLYAAAFACVAGGLLTRRFAWTNVSLVLWLFLLVRAWMFHNAPYSGRADRWLGLLLALTLAHHAGAGLATRAWLRRHGSDVLGVCAGLIALYAIYQNFSTARQASATFANRNFAGAGLAMLLPFALASRWRWWLAGLAILGLAATSSRGGFLAGMVALTVVFTYRRPRLRWLIAAVPVVIALVATQIGDSNTIKVRKHWYATAWDMGLAHPLTGTGADGFQREYPPVRPLEEHQISGGRVVHAVHNDYLESFAEGGFPGLLAHLLLIGVAAWALRRDGIPLASLAAFAAASLVDLPLRDPSLLALAFFALTVGARRRRLRAPLPLGAAGLLAIGWFFPVTWSHYRADREFGRHLTGDGSLDTVLTRERTHEAALLERGRERDLDLLLSMRPHHANALLKRTYHLPRDEMVPALRTILTEHDPHHTLTHLRLAQIVMKDDPLQAISVLERAARADPRPFRPHLMLARLHRQGGRIDIAEKHLRRAALRHPEVARERMELELAALRAGRVAPERFLPAVRRLPIAETRLRIKAALGRAQEIERNYPPPKFERREGEDLQQATLRFNTEKSEWRRQRDQLTALPYLEARLLAEALTIHDPTAEHYRLRGMAERDVGRAKQLEALALFLETLDALRLGETVKASRRFKLSLQAHPGLASEKNMVPLLRKWKKGVSAPAVQRARTLFVDHERLRKALE